MTDRALIARVIKHLKNVPKVNNDIYLDHGSVSYGKQSKLLVAELEAVLAAPACPYFTMPSECGRPKCRESGCIDPNVEYPKETTP